MKEPVDQTNLDSQAEYFKHLNITSWKGRLYRRYFLYPVLNYYLKGKTLDVGCGLGSFLSSRKSSVGIDINPMCIEYCKEVGLEAYHCPDPEFPFPANHFDSIIFDNVIEHLDDPRLLLSEIQRVLKPGGLFIIGVPTVKGYHSQADHRIFYDEKKLQETTSDYGFLQKKVFYMPIKSKYLEKNMNAHSLYSIFQSTD